MLVNCRNRKNSRKISWIISTLLETGFYPQLSPLDYPAQIIKYIWCVVSLEGARFVGWDIVVKVKYQKTSIGRLIRMLNASDANFIIGEWPEEDLQLDNVESTSKTKNAKVLEEVCSKQLEWGPHENPLFLKYVSALADGSTEMGWTSIKKFMNYVPDSTLYLLPDLLVDTK